MKHNITKQKMDEDFHLSRHHFCMLTNVLFPSLVQFAIRTYDCIKEKK